jgi:phage terminase small subunit
MAKSPTKKEAKEPVVKELSMEHERFCWLYVRKENGTRCYLMVHPDVTEDSARVLASRLLAKVDIKARIGILRAEREAALRIGEADIKADLAKLKNYNVQDFYNGDQLKPFHEIDPDLTYAIEGIEFETITTKDGESVGMTTKIKLANKLKPLELLGKTHKMFTDKTELSNPDGTCRPMIVNFVSPAKDE